MRYPLPPVVAALLLAAPLPAAEPDFQPVTLTTGDGVELAGRYAPGRLGRKSPAVIVLDDVRDAARPEVCQAAAARLAADGCAVLTFDFRGHRGSTAVAPEFWADPTNRRLVRGYSPARPKDRVSVADFRPGYLPALVNDVAAARAFLERRNDAGECNAGQVFVVGFGHGATVGTLWLGAEWQRFRGFGGFPERVAPAPEGRDVAGCVWVDLKTALDRQPAPVLDAARRASARKGVLFALVHADDDTRGAAVAADWGRRLNDPQDRETTVAARPVGGDGPVAARPTVPGEVASLVAAMRKIRPAPPWDERDFPDRRFVWSRPGAGIALAKAEGEEATRPVPAALLGN